MNPRLVVHSVCGGWSGRTRLKVVAAALGGACAAVVLLATSCQPAPDPPAAQPYVLLGWNNLGMHCYNQDSSDFLVLPPYNTLQAQVIQAGDPPQILTTGVSVEYSFPANTYSAGNAGHPDKTNFWQNVNALFGVNLAPNIGLTGKGLVDYMDVADRTFLADGIPLTEYRDEDARLGVDLSHWQRHPYQLALLVARDAATGAKLAENTIVAPVSSELSCDLCHADDGDATTTYPITPTGSIAQNILALHDYLSAAQYPPAFPALLMDSRPVLCAKCHASNALGVAGVPGVTSLSNAMHNRHKDLADITPDTDGCYTCHPGPQTQCLRCTMSESFALDCITCHGTMADVAVNPDPWLNEPRCDSFACHGPGYALNQALYRNSTGHGGIYCAGCHDSPHVIAPSRESSDGIKFINLQGRTGTLRDCTVCHLTQPMAGFVHGSP